MALQQVSRLCRIEEEAHCSWKKRWPRECSGEAGQPLAQRTPLACATGLLLNWFGTDELLRATSQAGLFPDDAEFNLMRRGWCLSDETFRQELLAQMRECPTRRLPWLRYDRWYATTAALFFCTLGCISPGCKPARLTVFSCGLAVGYLILSALSVKSG